VPQEDALAFSAVIQRLSLPCVSLLFMLPLLELLEAAVDMFLITTVSTYIFLALPDMILFLFSVCNVTGSGDISFTLWERLMEIRLVRSQGGAEQLRLPTQYDDEDECLELFDSASKLIHREWLERRGTEGSRSMPWLTAISYELLTYTLEADVPDMFDARIQQYGRGTRGRAPATPLHAGLLAMFAHDKGAWKPNERGRLGDRLWFAHRHYVPAPFVVAFLGQHYSEVKGFRRARDEIEPEMVEWVISRRLDAQLSDDQRSRLREQIGVNERQDTRGSYQTTIDAEVTRRLQELHANRDDWDWTDQER
jgi:hypothetical protein